VIYNYNCRLEMHAGNQKQTKPTLPMKGERKIFLLGYPKSRVQRHAG